MIKDKIIKYQLNYIDDQMIKLYEENNFDFLKTGEFNDQYFIDYLINEKFSIFEFIYFINEAIIKKDIKIPLAKDILNALLDIFPRGKKIKYKFLSLNNNDNYFDSFFDKNEIKNYIKYEDFIYSPKWRNRTINIPDLYETLEIFNITNDINNIIRFLMSDEHVLTSSIESKCIRMLDWILHDLNIKFNEFEQLKWCQKYNVNHQTFKDISKYFIQCGKLKKFNTNYVNNKYFTINKSEWSYKTFVSNFKNIFPNDYLYLIDYLNENTNKYICINNQGKIEVYSNKFVNLIDELFKNSEIRNFYFNQEFIKEKYKYIDWNKMLISNRYYENLSHKNILIINTKKQFYFSDFDKFYEYHFPLILNEISNMNPGWYCSNYFCEKFKDIFDIYGINDYQLIHKLLKYIFMNTLGNQYENIITFERQPGILIKHNDINEWIYEKYANDNLDKKQLVNLLRQDYGWGHENLLGFIDRLDKQFAKFQAEINNSNNVSEENIKYFKNLITTEEIVSKHRLLYLFEQHGLSSTYFNKYVINILLDSSLCDNYVTRRNNSLKKIVYNKIRELPIINLEIEFDKLVSNGITDYQYLNIVIDNFKKVLNLVRYDVNKYINLSLWNNDLNTLKTTINEYLEKNKNEFLNLEKIVNKLKNINFEHINKYINESFIKSYFLNINYKYFSFSNNTFINEKYRFTEDLLVDWIGENDYISIDELLILIENKLDLIFTRKELIYQISSKWKNNKIYYDKDGELLWKKDEYFLNQ